ncbi:MULTISPECIES: hypothetical protein [unclassified Chryseobacterium]|uniref:hypothetical protein n=1 Tax=unclassified Chryseobacterium TaxID=2593645 RepID=UPI000E0BB93D|nr:MULTISPECIES: hypothetical protein [unclassified Chryseobacterium]MDQ1859322.1 hypothetical protein [Chryseobacterium sp. WLY505]
MKKNYKIPLFLLLLFGIRIFAQFGNLTNIVPTTPEMSGLVKRVDIPVNYSSGAINYPLNIYTLKVSGFEIPITLNYTSTGFKPGENASNIGLGWDLEVGGKISHKVNGLDDLHSLKEYSVFPNGFPVDHPVKVDFVNPGAVNYPEYALLRDHSNSRLEAQGTFMRNPVSGIDTEPDIFHFSYPGKSSKFFLDKDFNGKQMPAGKEKIKFDGTKFTITDIQGNIYEYAVQDDITLQSDMVLLSGFYPYSGGNLIYNNYYLSKIQTKTDIIEFLYNYVDYAYDNPNSYMKGSTKDLYDIPTDYYSSSFEVKYLSKVTKHTLPLLSEIRVNAKTRVSFEYKSTPRTDVKNNFTRKIAALDKIKVQDGGNSYTAVFDQSYFQPANGDINDRTAWLKLNSVKINDQQYSFKYYEDSLIPNKDTDSKDFWGYYSQNGEGRYNVKDFKTYYYLGGKKPSLTNTQTTLLKEIIYPTKGSEEFVYENNTYDEPNYTEYGTNIINIGIYYSYEESNNGEFYKTENFQITRKTKFQLFYNIPYQPGGATADAQVSYNLINTSTNTLVSFPPMSGKGETELTLDQGSYSLSMFAKGLPDPYVQLYAEEAIVTGSGRKNLEVGGIRIAKIISKDTNGSTLFSKSISYDNESGISTGKIYDYPIAYELEHGYSFKYDPSVCKVLDKYFSLAKYYSTAISDILGYNGCTVFYSKATESTISNGNDNGKTVYSFYDEDDGKLYYDTPYLLFNDNSWKRGFIKKQEIFERGNTVPIKTITNSYSFIQTPTTQQIESGLDFSAPTQPNEFHKMSYQFFVTSPEYYLGCGMVMKNPAANFDFYGKKLVSAQVNKDREIIEENINGKLLRTETEYFYDNPLHIQPTSKKITFPDKSVEETTFKYADELGNLYLINKNIIGVPLETTVVKKINSTDIGKTISKLSILYPNSDIEANNKTSGLALPMSVSRLNIQNNTLSTELTYDQYDSKGNLQQYTTKNGLSTVIVWGYNQTQPIAKIEGAKLSDISQSLMDSIVTASNTDAIAAPNNDETTFLSVLNTFRSNSALSGYQITTYTYDPLVGVRSITPPSGIRESYVYDSANRLQKVIDVNGKVLKEMKYNYKN